ncbi:HlyD family secretion protein [Klebsiella variicola]|uniref:HlyD family secretion protein n=1 Tax=Klebsiella variicola TaxID=244366 RepID=UPI001C22D785|nr:HlyD family secretion protein [Klebsiella variicola]MBU9731526.1 HlyD family secretion protein [Klebsiella variicola]
MFLTPEQRFRRWTIWSVAVAALMFIYFVYSDMEVPLTPHSRLIYKVTPVASEVSGRVVKVEVENHQKVRAGDILFRVDDKDYVNALRTARIELKQAVDSNKSLDESISEALSKQAQAEATWQVAHTDALRYRQLKNIAVSRQQADQASGAEREAAAAIAQARASIKNLRIQRGLLGDDNLQIQKAMEAVRQAEINLARTTVRAESNGTVSNLNLIVGDYSSPGSPVMSVVSTNGHIYADFREKSLYHTHSQTLAWVVFDAIPGKTFQAHLIAREAGIIEGQLAADGKLVSTEESDRWVRDAQRIRIYLSLDEGIPANLVSGARATVQLVPAESGLLAFLGRLQIIIVSWLHYVY